MQKDDLILFFQAPANLPYLLKQYEENVGKKNIYIYVMNVENDYKFIKSLNLKVKEITFISYEWLVPRYRRTWLTQRKRVRKVYRQHFKWIKNASIYFYSAVSDWMTFYFVKKLSENRSNEVFYADHYDMLDKRMEKRPLNQAEKLERLMYWFVTGIWMDFNFNQIMYAMPYQRYNIRKIVAEEIQSTKDYQYVPNTDPGRKNILYLSNPWSADGLKAKETAALETVQFIKHLKRKGFNFIIKGHPRLLLDDRFAKAADEVIPPYILSEFINVDKVDVILCVESSAAHYFTEFTNKPVYSLIYLYHSASEESKDYYAQYLKDLTHGKINFLQSLDEL